MAINAMYKKTGPKSRIEVGAEYKTLTLTVAKVNIIFKITIKT